MSDLYSKLRGRAAQAQRSIASKKMLLPRILCLTSVVFAISLSLSCEIDTKLGIPSKDSLLYRYTRLLGELDWVEINEVRFSRSADAEGLETKVIKSVKLNGSEAERFTAVWRNLHTGVGAGCFSPAYLVKLYFKEKLLLGSTICFHCHNLTLPIGESSEIHPFDADGPTGRQLLKAIQNALAKSSTASAQQALATDSP